MSEKNIKGAKYGYLLATESRGKNKKGVIIWEFECTCGKKIILEKYSVTKGNTKSCGCMKAKMLSEKRQGDKNPMWKGDKVGYSSLHEWVKNKKKKPEKCEECGKKRKLLDLANISQQYKRDLDDWEYLCRKCHMEKDGRLKKFSSLGFQKGKIYTEHRKGKEIECIVCHKKVYRGQARPGKYCSLKCFGVDKKEKTIEKNKNNIILIKKLKKEGLSFRKIGKKLGITSDSVYYWYKNY